MPLGGGLAGGGRESEEGGKGLREKAVGYTVGKGDKGQGDE